MTDKPMTWTDLCGERELLSIRTDVRHPFSTEANGVALDLGNLTVFVFEDPSDGYRSSACEPLIAQQSLYAFGVSPEYVRVPVLIRPLTQGRYGAKAEGLEFIDRRNGKTVLLLGTDNCDDYYPSFTCEWTPANLVENATV